MSIFYIKFTNFMISILKPLIFILIVVSFGTIFAIPLQEGSSFIGLIPVAIIYLITGYIGYKTIKSEGSSKRKIGCILIIAFVFRTIWLININSFPTSDFKTMYDVAANILQGDYSMLRGNSYIARFPHLTIMVLYMALMRNIFPVDNLFAMKIVNLSMGIVSVLLIYLIAKEIFTNKKYSLYCGFVAAILPALVTYTGVFCSENLAMPFFLLSVYLFLKGTKLKMGVHIVLLSGVCLAIGNLFRGVATVVLVAYVIFLIIYFNGRIVVKLRTIAILVITFFLIMNVVSLVLRDFNVIENTLSKGTEPAITNVLKGTNISSGGRWNAEDARLPEELGFDYDKIEEKSKEIIIGRLSSTNPIRLVLFYTVKFAMQWNEGECAGVFWSQLDVPEEDVFINIAGGGKMVLQLIYVVVVILGFLGTINAKKFNVNKELSLIYLILCGYGALYLITESQSRYSYIVCWAFIFISVPGVDYILEKLKITKDKKLRGSIDEAK